LGAFVISNRLTYTRPLFLLFCSSQCCLPPSSYQVIVFEDEYDFVLRLLLLAPKQSSSEVLIYS